MDDTGMEGKLIIEFYPDVPSHLRPRLVNTIRRMSKSRGLHTFVRDVKTSGDTVIEICGHDRTPGMTISDETTQELMRFLAQSQGITVQEFIRKIVK